MSVIDADDNKEIIGLILRQLATGRKEYGHGFRVFDDTTDFGTVDDSWVEMALEEALDLSLYLAAALIRLKKIENRLTDSGKQSGADSE